MDLHFLDESGDCSFTDTARDEHFLITIVSVDEFKLRELKSALKRVFARFINSGWDKTREIKAFDVYNDRKFGSRGMFEILTALSRIDSLKVNYIVVRKAGITQTGFRKAPYGIAYNYFTYQLIETLDFHDEVRKFNLTFDKRNKETHMNRPFQEYIQTRLISKAYDDGFEAEVVIKPGDSQDCYGLKAADFISWSIFRKFERKDGQYFDIISAKVNKKKEWYT